MTIDVPVLLVLVLYTLALVGALMLGKATRRAIDWLSRQVGEPEPFYKGLYPAKKPPPTVPPPPTPPSGADKYDSPR